MKFGTEELHFMSLCEFNLDIYWLIITPTLREVQV
jgi:hypothetical protein